MGNIQVRRIVAIFMEWRCGLMGYEKQYIPMKDSERMWTIKDIGDGRGFGVYVDRDMDNGTILGNLYWTNGNGIAYIITELAKYTNHSQNPNVRASLHGDRLYCRAIRPIGKGEEVLMDYDQFQSLGIHNIEQSQPHWNTNPSNTVE